MIQSESMSDFVQCHTKPGTAIFALTPVDIGVHHRETTTTETRRSVRRHQRLFRSQVTSDHLNSAVRGFTDDHTGLLRPDLKDLTCSLLLILCNRVMQCVALRILPVNVREIEFHDAQCTGNGRGCPAGPNVRLSRDIAVTRFVIAARIRWQWHTLRLNL